MFFNLILLSYCFLQVQFVHPSLFSQADYQADEVFPVKEIMEVCKGGMGLKLHQCSFLNKANKDELCLIALLHYIKNVARISFELILDITDLRHCICGSH